MALTGKNTWHSVRVGQPATNGREQRLPTLRALRLAPSIVGVGPPRGRRRSGRGGAMRLEDATCRHDFRLGRRRRRSRGRPKSRVPCRAEWSRALNAGNRGHAREHRLRLARLARPGPRGPAKRRPSLRATKSPDLLSNPRNTRHTASSYLNLTGDGTVLHRGIGPCLAASRFAEGQPQ